MFSRIAIARQWSDDDVSKLVFEVCDGISRFSNEAYVSRGWGKESADALRQFGRQIHGGLFDLNAGQDGAEFAGGSFRARFHWHRPDQLLISTHQQGDFFLFKGSKSATEARMYLRTEPALLDRFVADLPALDAADGGPITLECVALPT